MLVADVHNNYIIKVFLRKSSHFTATLEILLGVFFSHLGRDPTIVAISLIAVTTSAKNDSHLPDEKK